MTVEFTGYLSLQRLYPVPLQLSNGIRQVRHYAFKIAVRLHQQLGVAHIDSLVGQLATHRLEVSILGLKVAVESSNCVV